MENFSFENLDLTKGFVESGRKVSNANRPELVVTSSNNRFTLNEKALDLLGIKKGARVSLFDMIEVAESSEQRFYIAANVVVDGDEKGALIGAGNSFTYSMVYGAIQATLADKTTKEIMNDELEDLGLMESNVNKSGKKVYVATNKIRMELVPVSDVAVPVAYNEDGTAVEAFVYALTNFKTENHTPQFAGDKEEELVEEVVVNDPDLDFGELDEDDDQ